MDCIICPHNCQIDRASQVGICQAPAGFEISHIQLHQWEEPCLSGTKGSGTIFFTHCNLKCSYCQNFKISQEGYGKIISQADFIKLVLKLKNQGAHNLNLVSPTCYTDLLAKIFPDLKKEINLPFVWNSNAYEKVETLKKLDGLVDVYLPDLKYYSNELALKYSQAPNYFPIALAAIKEMLRQVGSVEFDHHDLIKKGVIIRHLVLPGHIEDSKKVLQTIKDNFADNVWVSLMSQYYPVHKAQLNPVVNRTLTKQEYDEIKNFFEQLDFSGYFQEQNSASANYTPHWELGSLDIV
jgi:putative pyruvate formate lyase activating enzyme